MGGVTRESIRRYRQPVISAIFCHSARFQSPLFDAEKHSRPERPTPSLPRTMRKTTDRFSGKYESLLIDAAAAASGLGQAGRVAPAKRSELGPSDDWLKTLLCVCVSPHVMLRERRDFSWFSTKS